MKKRHGGLVEKRWTVGRVIMFAVLILYSASLIGVLLWTLLTAMKDRIEYIRDPVSLPEQFTFRNFIVAFTELQASGKGMGTMLFNSAWLSILPPTINLLTGAMAAYVMAQYKFPGRDLIWGIMIVTMTLPIMGTGAATYRLYLAIGMYDSPLILIRDIAGLGGGIMLIAAFKGVSKSYMEAAFLDGAGHFRIFLTIMLPQLSGLLSALWITGFIGCWNDYMTPIMYLPSYTPVTTGLYIYQKETERVLNVPVLFAAALMIIVIPLTLFAVFQDKFSEINFGGGIKS